MLVMQGGDAQSAGPSIDDVDVGTALKTLIDLLGSTTAYMQVFNGAAAFSAGMSTLIDAAKKI